MIFSKAGIKKIIILKASLLGLLICLHMLFQYVYRNETNTKFGKIHHLQSKQLDFIFLGNSRCLINAQVDSLCFHTNLKGYNLGLDGSNLMHQYLLLSAFVKNKNICKTLYMNYDPWGLQLKINKKQRIYGFLPHIDDDTVFTHLKRTFGKRAFLWKYIPFWKYAEFNARLGVIPLMGLISNSYKEPVNAFGDYIKINEKSLKKYPTFPPEKIIIRKKNLDYLEYIRDLCLKNNIKLVLYTSPAIAPFYKKFSNIDSVNHSVKTLINCAYYNFCDSSIGAKQDLFYDNHHLNKKGNSVLMPMLLKMINEQQ